MRNIEVNIGLRGGNNTGAGFALLAKEGAALDDARQARGIDQPDQYDLSNSDVGQRRDDELRKALNTPCFARSMSSL